MKILIDAHMIGERESGNERYAINLIRALSALELDACFVVAASHPELLADVLAGRPNWRVVRIAASPWRRLVFELPRLATREAATVTHVTYAAPPMMRRGVITTIHDVSFLPHPEWFSLRDRLVLRTGIGFTLAQGAEVITVSRHARDEIMTRYHIPAERISVTPEAADPFFGIRPSPDVMAEAIRRLGIPTPFVLAVGNLQPRKNLVRLVHAFADAKRSFELPHRLVIAGQAKWRESDVLTAIRQVNLEQDVTFAGLVTDSDLAALYHAADCFVYPSLYEGFGLPVLEAMACGTPVITSNVTSIPEVAGDAAVLVDPADTQALARALREVLMNPDLRQSLRRKGLERASLFTWAQTARKTWEAYQRAAARI